MPLPQGHVLTATDGAWQAFLRAANITGVASANIVRAKEYSDKSLPVVICNSVRAVRKRPSNYDVTGSIIVRSGVTDSTGNVTDAQRQASSDLEWAVLQAIEAIMAHDENPQTLGAAIQAAAVAAGVVSATYYLVTACRIVGVSADRDEDGAWLFSVDFMALVIA